MISPIQMNNGTAANSQLVTVLTIIGMTIEPMRNTEKSVMKYIETSDVNSKPTKIQAPVARNRNISRMTTRAVTIGSITANLRCIPSGPQPK